MIGFLRKAASAMRHVAQAPMLMGRLARTRFNYRREVGEGVDTSVVMAPIQFVQRAFPEGRFRVMRWQRSSYTEAEAHPLTGLIGNPNPFYGDEHLYAATVGSWYWAGNAYWYKARNGAGRVAELWYLPHWTMEPKWPADGATFLSHYKYSPGGGESFRLDPEDVVHFRHGVDPRNLRLGISPLHGALREIFVDLEASNMVASLLRNMGVPGLVLSPDGGARVEQDDVAAVKLWLKESFGGDSRGEPLVMGAPTKVQQYGFSPQQLDLSVARDVAEERVCALIGIPAAVVGFGAGLQTAKVGATMGELRALAWTNGIVPVMRAMAGEIGRSLLPEFSRGNAKEVAEFDTSEVAALAEQRLANATAWNTAIGGGWAEVGEGRDAIGLPTDDSHRIFLRSFSTIEVPAGMTPRPAPAIGENARKDRARPAEVTRLRGYVRALERMERPLVGAMEKRLTDFFGDLGRAAAAAARPLVAELAGRAIAAAKAGEEIIVGRIIEQLELPLHGATFRRLYEAHYMEVAKGIAEAGELVGIATDLPDPVARAIVAAGGRRAGLVDLDQQSRKAVFDALAEGRAAGEGVDQLVDRIRDQVESGPWGTAETRARTIARTETKYAQNISTVARAQHEGVQRFVVFDGRLGPGRSDPDHIARDGMIVTADEAARMSAEEHPNGTLSFAPHFDGGNDE